MAVFSYNAIDARQRTATGLVTADSPVAARQTLRAQGLTIQSLRPAKSVPSSAWLTRKPSPELLAELWRNLAMLIRAGTPLVEALDICRRQARAPLDAVLRRVAERVRGGDALSEALRADGGLLDEVSAAMLSVGEQSGALDSALSSIAEHLARRRSHVNELSSALLYPAILMVVGIGVVIFLMTAVVPQLIEVLTSAGRALPWPTRVLQAASGTITGNALLLSIAGAALLVVGVGMRRSAAATRWTQSLLLRLPLLGMMQQKLWVARITGLLATMLEVDVRFTQALAIVRRTLPHRLYAEELQRFETALERGATLQGALLDSRLIPPLVVHLLAIGQESGELPSMLRQIRDHYEAELRLALKRLITVLEPGLILILAAAIGFVVYATLLPILETTKVVQ